MLRLAILSLAACMAVGELNQTARDWPADNYDCAGHKQKAMYGKMTFSPSIKEKPMTSLNITVVFNELSYNPISNPQKVGGVYVAYSCGVKNGPGGYFGAQITHRRDPPGQFIFSWWDLGRMGPHRVPQKASRLAWPVDMERCHRNCQDCNIKKTGVTTGTQCLLPYDVKVGAPYKVMLVQLNSTASINTADYGGMSEGLQKLGEKDGVKKGGIWEVKVKDLTLQKTMSVGKIFMEGDGSGMDYMKTFEEMLGCVKCNAIQHKSTRYGLEIGAADGSVRKPIKMEGVTNAGLTVCTKFSITGSEADHSISFEIGPFIKEEDIFPYTGRGKFHLVWPKE